jgi:hypothetical protein
MLGKETNDWEGVKPFGLSAAATITRAASIVGRLVVRPGGAQSLLVAG